MKKNLKFLLALTILVSCMSPGIALGETAAETAPYADPALRLADTFEDILQTTAAALSEGASGQGLVLSLQVNQEDPLRGRAPSASGFSLAYAPGQGLLFRHDGDPWHALALKGRALDDAHLMALYQGLEQGLLALGNWLDTTARQDINLVPFQLFAAKARNLQQGMVSLSGDELNAMNQAGYRFLIQHEKPILQQVADVFAPFTSLDKDTLQIRMRPHFQSLISWMRYFRPVFSLQGRLSETDAWLQFLGEAFSLRLKLQEETMHRIQVTGQVTSPGGDPAAVEGYLTDQGEISLSLLSEESSLELRLIPWPTKEGVSLSVQSKGAGNSYDLFTADAAFLDGQMVVSFDSTGSRYGMDAAVRHTLVLKQQGDGIALTYHAPDDLPMYARLPDAVYAFLAAPRLSLSITADEEGLHLLAQRLLSFEQRLSLHVGPLTMRPDAADALPLMELEDAWNSLFPTQDE